MNMQLRTILLGLLSIGFVQGLSLIHISEPTRH